MNTLIALVLGYMAGVSTPYAKKLFVQIILNAYKKAKAEINRWFK